MNSQAPVIQAEGLGKVFTGAAGQVRVLEDVDMRLEAGGSLSVVGASGVGKSTLLYILGALEPPSAGRVWLMGREVYTLGSKALARLRNQELGFVFQFHHLMNEFSALENAAMPAIIGSLGRAEALARAESILTRVGLADRLTHRVGELSGGEQQRVAVARALVNEPRVLLADEPTGNLDERTGRRIHELLAELGQEKGLATIVVTHNLELAKMMSSQVRLVDGHAIIER